jgi:hypothetical protein
MHDDKKASLYLRELYPYIAHAFSERKFGTGMYVIWFLTSIILESKSQPASRNPILFAICTSGFSKLFKSRMQRHVEECSVALLCD